ncbi:MAG: hypothetical protein ABI162_16565 [Luteolibacter sp.]
MLSADEHPGLFYFMAGMIVLVMAGVGLSLVVDRHSKMSSGNTTIQKEIVSGDEEVANLKGIYEERAQLLAKTSSQLTTGTETSAALLRKSTILAQRQAGLEATRKELLDAVPKLELAFSNYRAEYRRQTWAAAMGEKLGTLRIRGGREYQDAVISRVTDVGIEIHHKDGIARVQAPDLDQKWQDRFQWSDEERRARLMEESENHKQIASEPEPEEVADVEPVLPHPAARAAITDKDQAKLDALRIQVVGWKNKVARVKSELSQAQSQSAYGNQTSVPGSLETWKAKTARISAELVKAKAELSVAKSRLELVSPNDALLREPRPDSEEY